MSGVKDFNVPFKDVLANITTGLDVDVYYKELGHSFGKVHVNIVSESLDKRQWLIDTTYANHHENQRYVNYINSNYNRLRYIYHNGKIVGLAALNTLYQQHSSYMDIHTVGGLSTFLVVVEWGFIWDMFLRNQKQLNVMEKLKLKY